MSDYPIRSTARKFYDIDGNEVTLWKLIKLEPEWARNRILTLEEEIQQLQANQAVLLEALESISKNTCCGDCQEAKRVAIKALKAVKE